MREFNLYSGELFENYLRENPILAQSFHPNFERALNEMLLAGGKRFRPKLFLAVVNAINPLLIRNSMQIALAIEMLHTYSLIHDDLPAMDNANLRRSHPTLHKSYDETIAILAGDALNTHSLYLISTSSLDSDIKVELIQELTEAGGAFGMVLGQAIDCYFENQKLDLEQLKFLHIHKTAKLIASSLKMGAIVVQLERELSDRLYQFGLKLGLMFQIQDDIIDVTLSSKESGKTTGVDESKNSFVNLLGLDEAKIERDRLVDELKSELESFPKALKRNTLSLIEKYF